MRARETTLGLALVGVVLVAGDASGEEPTPPALRLAWLDVEGVAVGVDGVARSECRSVLEGAGLAVEWRRGKGGEEARRGEIRIILVDHLVMDPYARRSIMGATPAEWRQHPVAWIHVASVRATLGFPPDFPILDLPLKARRDLGVALGRVVAHEVVHVLAPGVKHGDSGLMSTMLTRNKLISPRLSMEPRVRARVRRALFDGSVPTEAYTGVLAASSGLEAGERALTHAAR
jgi:hypothetical protein